MMIFINSIERFISLKVLTFFLLTPLLWGCDERAELSCAEGTREENGRCLPTQQLICGEGTREEGGLCVLGSASMSCGPGTHEDEGSCVPDAPARSCGAGTVEVDGVCAPAFACGPGTQLVDGECAPSSQCGPDTELIDGACVPTLDCGPGTERVDGACVPTFECGPGTELVDGACVPTFECGPGTELVDGACVPTFERGPGTELVEGGCVPVFECGPGTELIDERCLPTFECGPGTVLVEGECLPDFECGPGTELVEGSCVPLVECGPETIPVEGVCVPSFECGPGTTLRRGHCVSDVEQWLSLPFPAGSVVEVGQGHSGYFSHNNESHFAIDFPLPEGSPIVAARAGVVLAARGDSNQGCGDISCADDANYVLIDHGDGTRGQYWHLQQNGALVVPGEFVCAGQLIGLSGNTGFSTGPHLHFAVIDPFGLSLPPRFYELEELTDGVVFGGAVLRSQNEEAEECVPSGGAGHCPSELFLHRGVRLERSFPCARLRLDEIYPISGEVFTESNRLQLAIYNPRVGEWAFHCIDADDEGQFVAELRFPSAEYRGGAFIMLSAARPGEDCSSFYGWNRSIELSFYR